MTREEQIKQASIAYTEADCPKAIGGDYFRNKISQFNINHDFIEGAQWADKTMLKEVLEWLDSHTYNSWEEDLPVQVDFTLKDDMFQSFKERFNIE